MHFFISFNVAIPVDKIIGFFVLATSSTNLKSLISKDEILNSLTLNFFKNLTAFILKGVLNNSIPNFFESLKASWCQLYGV